MKKLILFILMLALSTSTIQALPKHDMHDKAFAEMEQKYGVSATFAKGKLKKFGSVDESIDYFGSLLSSDKYKGMSIEEIGREYCPTDKDWARDAKKIMRRIEK